MFCIARQVRMIIAPRDRITVCDHLTTIECTPYILCMCVSMQAHTRARVYVCVCVSFVSMCVAGATQPTHKSDHARSLREW